MRNAELQEKDFVAEKQNTVIITTTSYQQQAFEPASIASITGRKEWNDIPIPRRPKWDSNTTGEELKQQEKQSFLEWRRSLAEIEEKEGVLLTPFERNLEVWRQLWRVIEKSDVIIQIVDARNPLLFRSTDLEKYVKEVDKNKRNILLVNKADLLNKNQRYQWGKFFKTQNIDYKFFSANEEQDKIDKEKDIYSLSTNELLQQEDYPLRSKSNRNKNKNEDDDDEDDDNYDEDEEYYLDENEMEEEYKDNDENDDDEKEEDKKEEKEEDKKKEKEEEEEDKKEEKDKKENNKEREEIIEEITKIYTRDEIMEYLIEFYQEKQDKIEIEGNGIGMETMSMNTNIRNRLLVGMVGYPNVGKSSTINVLVGEKKVAVASTPGKTKHFQTINISDWMCLCDCPGLVFPTFATTKADMMCNGLLSIDHMREHRDPITLVCERIPSHVFEKCYGITLPKPTDEEDPNRPPTSEELLQSCAKIRGFMTTHGMPNESQSARQILKDYVNGKLCFIYPPPGLDPVKFNKNTKQLYTYNSAQLLQSKIEHLENIQQEEPRERDPQKRNLAKNKKQKRASRKRLEVYFFICQLNVRSFFLCSLL